jgi:hypothetical protein
MTILHIEGFEQFGGTNGALNETQINRKWPDIGLGTGVGDNGVIIAGDNSAAALRAGRTGETAFINFPLPSGSEFYVSFYIRVDNDSLTTVTRLASFAASGSEQCSLQLVQGDSSGWKLQINRGTGTSLETTGGRPFTNFEWHLVEWHIVIGNSGSWEVKLDNSTVLSGSGDTQNLAGSAATEFNFLFHAGVISGDTVGIMAIDNVVIQDSAGAFLSTAATGSWYIEGIVPTSETADADFTPSTGTDNSALVDEIPADDDTTYVESATVSDRDLYNYANLTAIPSGFSIYGIQINTTCFANSSEDLITVIDSNGSILTSAGEAPGGTYETLRFISETDPDTATTWSESSLNAATFGIEVG